MQGFKIFLDLCVHSRSRERERVKLHLNKFTILSLAGERLAGGRRRGDRRQEAGGRGQEMATLVH
jgi:hypothetical protein